MAILTDSWNGLNASPVTRSGSSHSSTTDSREGDENRKDQGAAHTHTLSTHTKSSTKQSKKETCVAVTDAPTARDPDPEHVLLKGASRHTASSGTLPCLCENRDLRRGARDLRCGVLDMPSPIRQLVLTTERVTFRVCPVHGQTTEEATTRHSNTKKLSWEQHCDRTVSPTKQGSLALVARQTHETVKLQMFLTVSPTNAELTCPTIVFHC